MKSGEGYRILNIEDPLLEFFLLGGINQVNISSCHQMFYCSDGGKLKSTGLDWGLTI